MSSVRTMVEVSSLALCMQDLKRGEEGQPADGHAWAMTNPTLGHTCYI